jgi:hypothetical protein
MKSLALIALVLTVFVVLNAKGLRSLADAVGKDITQARRLVDAVGNDITQARTTADAVGKNVRQAHSAADAVGKDIAQARSAAEAARTRQSTPAAGAQNAAATRATPKNPQASSRSTSATMNQASFWQLIGETRAAAGNDTGRQSELLKEQLAKLPGPSILQFDRIRHSFDLRAYSYDIWGAAYVMEDGCSDDCFRDFRGYLISLGRGPYEAALQNPDSLAAVAQDAETGNWEGADNPSPDAYASATGSDFPIDEPDLSGTPRGKPFDENDTAALAARYPRLYARFR